MDYECRPMPHLTADANSTTVRIYDFLDDCQPQPRAMAFATGPGGVYLIEPVKEAWQRFFRDADT